MKICGPLSRNNELIWSMHKASVAKILKVTLKQTLIFYHLHQKIYTWRTADKCIARFRHTLRYMYTTCAHKLYSFRVTKIVTVFNCLVHNRDIIPKRIILSTWKWYLTLIYQIVKHKRSGIMWNILRKGCKCACSSPSIPVVSLWSNLTWLSVNDKTLEQVRISLSFIIEQGIGSDNSIYGIIFYL